MKLCTHIVTFDTGLAPNPFHGYCTTALCTPSHRKARLAPGNWLIGHSGKEDGYKLVYAMAISDVLSMDAYFLDSRFQSKKPNPIGKIEDQCGDNLYYQDPTEHWKRLPSRFHNTCGDFHADIKALRSNTLTGSPVFVANHFYYFGANRIDIPNRFKAVINAGRSIKHTDSYLAQEFVAWIESDDNKPEILGDYKPGILGRPKDVADHSQDTGSMITDYSFDCNHVPAEDTRGCQSPCEEHNKGPRWCR